MLNVVAGFINIGDYMGGGEKGQSKRSKLNQEKINEQRAKRWTMYFQRGRVMLWNINFCIDFVGPLIFTGMQKGKTGFFYKSNHCVSFIYRWFIYLLCCRTLNSASINPFGRCSPCCQVCSNYFGSITI